MGVEDITRRFAFTSEEVERMSLRLYQDWQRAKVDGDVAKRECRTCKIECLGGHGVIAAADAERGFLNALEQELSYRDEKVDLGIWYTNKGIAGYRARDHHHIVPEVIEKLVMASLSPIDSAVTLPPAELPRFRKIRLPNEVSSPGP